MRFFLPAPEWPTDQSDAVLDPSESRHAATVLRLRPGDAVTVFDGLGREATARVVESGKQAVRLAVGEPRLTARPAMRLVLAVAIPKGSTIDWIIEKAVELGAAQVIPLLTERTVVRLAPADRVDRQRKWQRIALEAAKQCGQNWLPSVLPPQPLADALASAPPSDFQWPLVASLQPDARPLAPTLAALPAPAAAALWIGPEGDFTPDEYHQLRAAGLLPVSLGPTVLRVETAALYGLSALQFAATQEK
jgi:16S rRNA (uracil1498-N3)-methyltransferase